VLPPKIGLGDLAVFASGTSQFWFQVVPSVEVTGTVLPAGQSGVLAWAWFLSGMTCRRGRAVFKEQGCSSREFYSQRPAASIRGFRGRGASARDRSGDPEAVESGAGSARAWGGRRGGRSIPSRDRRRRRASSFS
jgi:hypothetical protein